MKKLLISIVAMVILSSCGVMKNIEDFNKLSEAEKAKYRRAANSIYYGNRIEGLVNQLKYDKNSKLIIVEKEK